MLIPSLRHPMTNAAAIATLVELAGAERVAVAVGTGFTGRFTLGQKPLRWAFVADYVRTAAGPCCAARSSSGRGRRCR